MKKLKQIFQEKVILSAVMCVLLAVVLVSATYGWYALNNATKSYGLDLKTGGTGGIKVAAAPGGEDIMETGAAAPVIGHETIDGKKVARISMKLTDFINIENDMIAPGAYGELPLYITALNQSIKSYSIKVQLAYEPGASVSAAQKKEIEAMIGDHIMVCEKKTMDGTVAKFSDPLTYYVKESDSRATAATGALKYNEEVPVVLYWVWNYEVVDIPTGYAGIGRYAGLDEKAAIRLYDEEDTKLGNYVDDIWFNIYVEGSAVERKN